MIRITQSLLDKILYKQIYKPFLSVGTNNNICLSRGLVEFLELKAGNEIVLAVGENLIEIDVPENVSGPMKLFTLTKVNSSSSSLQFKSVLLRKYIISQVGRGSDYTLKYRASVEDNWKGKFPLILNIVERAIDNP